MKVKELCSNYGLKFQTVYKKISHHKDKELAGHFTKAKGESLELDDFAVDFLLPTHVKVMQAIEECEGIARENPRTRRRRPDGLPERRLPWWRRSGGWRR